MIVIIGRAGAGKTVQGKKLAEELGYAWVSPGALLRQKLKGEEAQKIIRGDLFNNSVIYDAITEEVKSQLKTKAGIVLEGFPRGQDQADWLIEQLKSGVFNIEAVIHLLAPKDLALSRLIKRARPDDNESAIKNRFNIYETQNPLILQKLALAGLKIHEINGEGSVDEVHQNILASIKA